MNVIERSETFKALGAAMLSVQKAVSGVTKDTENTHFKSRYASLENVVAAIRPACLEAGLLVTQAAGCPTTERGLIPVETLLSHPESGEWLRTVLAMPVTKADAQGVGSAITYACRYSLMAVFNIPPVDDDGNAAVRGNGQGTTTTAWISPEQQEELQRGIMDADIDLPKFLKFFGVSKLGELTTDRFDDAKAAITAKAAKKAKAA